MKYLCKYPQRESPYGDLVGTNRRRSGKELEYELIDTGVFDDDRYFDVFLEYATQSPEDILIRVSVHNREPQAARLHLLPTLWFRSTWSWGEEEAWSILLEAGPGSVAASHAGLGEYVLACEGACELLFTENESNAERLRGQPNPTPHLKDAFQRFLVGGERGAVNPERHGTKAAAHYALELPPGGCQVVRLRLSAAPGRTKLGASHHPGPMVFIPWTRDQHGGLSAARLWRRGEAHAACYLHPGVGERLSRGRGACRSRCERALSRGDATGMVSSRG